MTPGEIDLKVRVSVDQSRSTDRGTPMTTAIVLPVEGW